MKHFETISERLATTIANIEFQQGRVFWDDLEKLEEVLQRVKKLEEANEQSKTMKQYCCYYSQIDKQGNKLDLSKLNRFDDLFKVIEANSAKEVITKFSTTYPNLRMIGVRKNY